MQRGAIVQENPKAIVEQRVFEAVVNDQWWFSDLEGEPEQWRIEILVRQGWQCLLIGRAPKTPLRRAAAQMGRIY